MLDLHKTPETVTRIYVASLSDYNAGRLHGVWIDCADKDGNDIGNEVLAMLEASKEPVAEEWAIHDHDGFGNLVNEWSTFERVADLAALIQEHGPAIIAFAEYHGEDATSTEFDDAYRGEWDSEQEYAENMAEECGYVNDGSDNPLLRYIDWEAWTRDVFMDMHSAPSSTGVYVFQCI